MSMQSLRPSSSFPIPSASDVSCHQYKTTDNNQDSNLNWTNKCNQVVVVNEHKDSDYDDKDDNKTSRLLWKRNRKSNSNGNQIASNPSSSILVLSTRKQHKHQPLGITLRQETSHSGGMSPGVYLTEIAPHSPFYRAGTRFLPKNSKIVLVNGQPCPPSVKEVANRLIQVPQGAVLTLHFEVSFKNIPKKSKTAHANNSSLKRPSLFRRSRSSQDNMLNPIYVHYEDKERGKRLPPSILKATPKYSSNALTSMGCSGVPSPMQMLLQTTALHYQAAKILHDEAVLELEQLGKFLTQSWSTSTAGGTGNSSSNTSTSLIEETNNRWASIRADELAEF